MKNSSYKLRTFAFTAATTLAISFIVASPSLAAPKTALMKSFKKNGLSGVPLVRKAVVTKNTSAQVAALSEAAPPNLVDLGDANLDEIIWDGALASILSNTATVDQCNRFHRNMGTCHLAQATLQGLGSAEEGQTSLCYMSNITKAGGGMELEGSVKKADLFDPPTSAKSRYVKIDITGFNTSSEGEGEGGGGPQQIVARIRSVVENGSKYAYRADLAFCDPESKEQLGFNRIVIGSDGKMTLIDSHGGGDNHAFMFTGYLAANASGKSVKFDNSKKRSFTIESSRDNGHFLAKINISNDKMTLKTTESNGDHSRNGIATVQFSGTSLANAKFLKGGFKIDEGSNEFSGGAEWDGSKYLAVESNSLLEAVEDENLDESFYNTVPDGELSVSGLPSCSRDSFDATATLDMSHPDLQAVVALCEPVRGGAICWENDAVRDAEEALPGSCGFGG